MSMRARPALGLDPRVEAQLQAEVADLLGKAEAADQADVPDGMQVPEELARREQRLAEIACAAAGIDPVIAMGREAHHPSLEERFAQAPPPPQDPTPLAAMGHWQHTPEGKQRHAPRLRTSTPRLK
jgi:hypothetical protein